MDLKQTWAGAPAVTLGGWEERSVTLVAIETNGTVNSICMSKYLHFKYFICFLGDIRETVECLHKFMREALHL